MSSILYSTSTWGWIEEDVQTSDLQKSSHYMREVILSLCFDKSSCIFLCLI
jgi:hypothetical protein